MKTILLTLALSLSVSAAKAATVFRNPLPIRHFAASATDLLPGDFNGDGHQDLLVVDEWHGFNVLLANGTGPFAAPKVTPVTVQRWGTRAVGDVNGDGKLDLLYVDSQTSTVTVLRGNGDGTFLAGSSFVAAVAPGSLAIADFNGDGHADVAAGASDLAIHLGNGSGQFGAGTVTAEYSYESLATADLNGDGKADLIAGGGQGFEARVLLSNGNGTFLQTDTLLGGPTVFGDFNHDGKLDAAVAQKPNIRVALGDGLGGFAEDVGYVTGYETTSLDAADLDGDGNLDLLGGGNVVTVLRGNADGSFDPPDYVLANGHSTWIAVADFDRDGAKDFVTAPFRDQPGALSFVRGHGDGTFAAYPAMHVRETLPIVYGDLDTRRPLIADMNGDGRLDVVTVHEQRRFDNSNATVSVLFNDGNGKLARPVLSDTSLPFNSAPSYDLGDLNGDGFLDAVVITNNGFTIRKPVSLLGNGDGTFDPAVVLAIETPFGHPKIGQFDGDANADLFVPSFGGVRMYPGNGDGTFGAEIPSAANVSGHQDVRYGDLNGDGKLDFVSAGDSPLTAHINDGTGRFTKSVITASSLAPAAVADFDGDGKLDVLALTGTGTQLWFGAGNGTFANPVSFTISPAPDGPVTVADYDGDGKVDVSFGTAVYLSNGDGTFRSRARYRAGISVGAAAGDLDGSGSSDLVFVGIETDDVGVLLTRTYPDPTATPTLDLTASKTTAQYAETVTFTATVAGGDVPLTGTVVFSNGEQDVALVAVDDDGQAVFTGAFATGSYTITARYAGDEYYREASDSAGLTVTKAKPTIVLSPSANPAPYGFTLRIYTHLSAPKAANLTTPTGTITVRRGQTTAGTVPASTSPGAFVGVDPMPPIGSHVFHAEYSGDANYDAVTASFTQEIVKGTLTPYLTVSPPSGHIFPGQPVQLRAAITSGATGTMTFYAGNSLLATVALTGGVADVTTSFATWGNRSVRAVYSGDATWNPAETTQSVTVLIGSWGTPLQLVARAIAADRVAVQWSELQGATSYKLWRRTTLGSGWTLQGTYPSGGTSFAMPANTSQLFAVSAVDAHNVESQLSAPDLATTVLFTDVPLVSRVTRVKALHLVELRAAIGIVRAFAGLPAFSYANTVASGQRIRKVDLTETRTALAQARSAIGVAPIAFTDATPTTIRAVHVTELRAGVE